MSVLIIGGDKRFSIDSDLQGLGVEKLLHWGGRRRSETQRELPKNLDLVVMNTKFLNHTMMKKFKIEAKKRDIPVFFSHSQHKSSIENGIKEIL